MSGFLPCRYIGEVKEGDVRWKVKVIVVDKGNICAVSSHHTVQKCLVEDEEGTPIEALMCNNHIVNFKGTLEPLRTYMIQGAKVRKIEDLHWAGDRTLEWLMKGRTVTELITDENEILPYPSVRASSLSVVQTFTPYARAFNVVVAVVHVEKARQDKASKSLRLVQVLWVTDESLMLMPITMQGEFLKNQAAVLYQMKESIPIVVCRGLTITQNAGTSSPATNVSSYVSIEPNIGEVRRLRLWVSTNMNVLRAMKPTGKVPRWILVPPDDSGMEIQIGETSNGAPRYNIRGKMRIPDAYQWISICECSECRKIVVAEMKKEVHCRNCNELHEAVPSCKVDLYIQTTNGTVAVTLFADAAQKLLQHTPEQIHNLTSEEVKKLLFQVNHHFEQRTVRGIMTGSVKLKATQKPIFILEEWTEEESLITSTARTATETSPKTKAYSISDTHNTQVICETSEQIRLPILDQDPQEIPGEMTKCEEEESNRMHAKAMKKMRIEKR